MNKLTHDEVTEYCHALADRIVTHFGAYRGIHLYPIPRGGVPVAYLLQAIHRNIVLVDDPAEADAFVDDLIDSGATMEKYCDAYPGTPFFAMIDKTEPGSKWNGVWAVFPWEATTSEDDSIVGTLTNRLRDAGASFHANDNISEYLAPGEMDELQKEVEKRVDHFLRGLLIDVDNDHNTVGTAHRISKMYLREIFKGRYLPAPKVTDFPNAKQLDEMYLTGPITIRSACSHHFAPILGKCWIGIIPGERVIGLSKFNRIVDWIASRGTIQEEMTVQIADFIEQQIKPIGLAVIVEATHQCMTWRGVKEPMDAKMTTSIMRGAFRSKPEARAEFMTLVAK